MLTAARSRAARPETAVMELISGDICNGWEAVHRAGDNAGGPTRIRVDPAVAGAAKYPGCRGRLVPQRPLCVGVWLTWLVMWFGVEPPVKVCSVSL